MKKFESAKKAKKVISQKKLNQFSSAFNKKIRKGELTANTGLDGIPFLNDDEFVEAQVVALKSGYRLTQSEDNYQTTTYTLHQ
jgi:hypothetical protein